jgi:pimeloyl-ACP methyl ester carboxylesterase
MPLIIILRLLFGLGSWAVLGAGAYLLWTWRQGELVRDLDGDLILVRETWRLWTALGLFAWSFLGKRIWLPLLARPDEDEPSRPERGEGRQVEGASGASLYVETHGPAGAPTLILTHGWGLDSTIWSYAKRDLGDRFRLILWDLPGLGRSRAAEGGINLTAFAADLGTVIGLAGEGPVVLVGHSIGGMTIQTLARDQPELFGGRVAGAVLVNTTYTNPLETMVLSGLAKALRWPVLEPMMRLASWLQPLAWLSGWQSYLSGSAHMANRLGFGDFVTRSQLEHTTLLSVRNPPGASAKGNLAMFRWDGLAGLPNLAAPTLVIGGDKDIVTKLEASLVIAEIAPQAELRTMNRVNHMGFLERADLYNAAIAAFADSVVAEADQVRAAPAEVLRSRA